MNPGGPGGEGTVQTPAWMSYWPETLLRDFDIVSWDPRGIGASTAVQCFATSDQEGRFLGKYADFPATRSQQAGFIRRWRAFGAVCARRAGPILGHDSTADTARDLAAGPEGAAAPAPALLRASQISCRAAAAPDQP